MNKRKHIHAIRKLDLREALHLLRTNIFAKWLTEKEQNLSFVTQAG